MSRTHTGVLSSQALTRWTRLTIAMVVWLSLPAHASAEGPIARAVRAHVATGAFQLSRPAARFQRGQSRGRGPGRIVAGAAVGATAGFFAGGYLGSWIDGDCGGCDDPGFKGALIGAPIGAVVGGIFGGKFLF